MHGTLPNGSNRSFLTLETIALYPITPLPVTNMIIEMKFPLNCLVYPAKFNREGLTTIAIYESYDEPVFYSAKDSAGQTYLVLALPKGWLSTPITKLTLEKMRRGIITLYEAFKSAEFSFVETDGLTIVALTKNLPEDYFPTPETYLKV